ncbi:hypothetical protein GT030_34435, partial [Streptomyces sp. SID1328]|nr:hypothetical protein [Streptomyces sp. SID1328]
LWDLTTGQPIAEPLTGHTNFVNAVTCTTLRNIPIAVSASWDKTVRLWNLNTGQPIGQPLTGHAGPVYAVACTLLDDTPIAVTASWD